jgi:hypothetical protein
MVSKLLCKLKFKDIRVLTAKEPGFILLPDPVKVVYTNFLGSDAACRLYGSNYFVRKGTNVVCERDKESDRDRRMGLRIRHEIKEIIASGPYYYDE